jgi:hypothetical protein
MQIYANMNNKYIEIFKPLTHRTTSRSTSAKALKLFGNKQMKRKFQNFDFGAVEVLSQEEQSKVKGGYSGGPTGLPQGWCYRFGDQGWRAYPC